MNAVGGGLLAGVIGGMAGMGEGIAKVGEAETKANAAKTLREQEAEIQRERDELIATRQSAAAEKEQIFKSGESKLNRDQQSSENALNRDATQKNADRSHETDLKRLGLEGQRLSQGAGLISAQTEAAELSLTDKKNLNKIRDMYVAETDQARKSALAEQYQILSGKEDRYKVINTYTDGQISGQTLFDTTTKRPIDTQSGSGASSYEQYVKAWNENPSKREALTKRAVELGIVKQGDNNAGGNQVRSSAKPGVVSRIIANAGTKEEREAAADKGPKPWEKSSINIGR